MTLNIGNTSIINIIIIKEIIFPILATKLFFNLYPRINEGIKNISEKNTV